MKIDAFCHIMPRPHYLILVRPDLHVVWRGHDELPDPDALAALATGHSH